MVRDFDTTFLVEAGAGGGTGKTIRTFSDQGRVYPACRHLRVCCPLAAGPAVAEVKAHRLSPRYRFGDHQERASEADRRGRGGVDQRDIGQFGGGKRTLNGRLDVAMLQSLVRSGRVDDIVATYGHVIADECHHVPAVSFERVLSKVRARYVLGLTATPHRRDGHHPILQMQLGPVRYCFPPRSHAARAPFVQKLIVRKTAFRLDRQGTGQDSSIHHVYQALAHDPPRNDLILNDVIAAIEEGRSPVLLTEHRDHLEYFADRLRGFVRSLVVLHGGLSARERREAAERLAEIPDDEERLVLATGRYLGEGFDDARLDTLFLALPVSWKGTLVQYAGRLHRLHPRKREVRVFDYLDPEVPMLRRMFERRLRTYRAIGYVPAEPPMHHTRPGDRPVICQQEALF